MIIRNCYREDRIGWIIPAEEAARRAGAAEARIRMQLRSDGISIREESPDEAATSTTGASAARLRMIQRREAGQC